ncbi:uracil-DNA glycosylase [Rhizophagus irregularis]|uniref:Uracil-DNA glycosylase n=2 Tax=Rhizophagus irregularis TaxID=588596 RepID=A0A2I1E8F3_9GLOM|nr:uracil-DNA glycosylase [Rhizophagus irregularis]PKC70799.1 uracil-DNA glycosylase [Rhizophagus irregularis]PKY18410.1 uracil-DNA glycosylase [Rhizophagus irregularis]
MLKRKITSTFNNNKKQKATTLTQSSLSYWVNPQPQTLSTINSETLFNKIGNENKELLSLEIKTMNSEWLKVLSGEMQKPYFIELKKYLQNEKANNKKIFPPEPEIYSWSRFTPPSSVKVVIIGQDPYHNVGQAHGLCFSVPHGVPPPPSLINIYNSLKKDIPSFQIPKHGNLINWAKAGVLLLNTSLTVRAHEAASHSGKGWEKFTDAVIQYLNEKENGLVFMLWGNHAIKKGKNINENKHLVLQTVHPSPLSAHRGFLVCCHWSKANAYLKSHGKQEIEWNCLSAAD